MSSAFHPNRFFRREEQNEGFMPSGVPAGRAPTLTAPPTSDQLLTRTDTPRSHGGDKAKVSGRRSWLSPTLSYSDDPAPRGTLSPVGSIFNLLTVPRAEPQGSSQAQRQASLACANTKLRLLHTYWLRLERFQNSLRVPIGQAPKFLLRRFNNELYKHFLIHNLWKEAVPAFSQLASL